MDERLDALFSHSRAISRRGNSTLVPVIDRALRLGEIEAVLPGVYVQPGHQAFFDVRIEALQLYEPKAVLVEHAAARLTFWQTIEVDAIAAAVPRKLSPRAGFRFLRRTVPHDLVEEVDGVPVTRPALTALDLGADAIDRALRTGAVTLDEMRAAMAAIRWQPGNAARRLVLQESSNDPWSTAERQFHRLLRAAEISGWRANVKPRGVDYTVDVVFDAERLVVEIDGRHYHGDANFEFDRWRQNTIVLARWRVLRFTWTMIDDYPDRVIETVRTALAQS